MPTLQHRQDETRRRRERNRIAKDRIREVLAEHAKLSRSDYGRILDSDDELSMDDLDIAIAQLSASGELKWTPLGYVRGAVRAGRA